MDHDYFDKFIIHILEDILNFMIGLPKVQVRQRNE